MLLGGVVKMNDEFMKIAFEKSKNANCAKGSIPCIIDTHLRKKYNLKND